jgi:two-component system cell cycle sensor histidine kinase/response regulator CckA
MKKLDQFSERQTHRVLIIDDTPKIHEDFRKILCGEDLNAPALDATEALLLEDDAPAPATPNTIFEVDSASQGEEGIAMVQRALDEGRPYSMAFVDVRMPPGLDGIKTIGQIWERYPELQVVICTAYSDYSWKEIASHLGMSENLVILKKPFDSIEVLQLAHAMTKKWIVTQQANARLEDLSRMVHERTAELSEANERFSKAFQASPLPIAVCKVSDGRFLDANESFLLFLEIKRDGVIGRADDDLKIWADSGEQDQFWAFLEQDRRVAEMKCRIRLQSGAVREVLAFGEEFQLYHDRCVLMLFYDITDRLKLEEELRQSQKMEAVGQLAAGVAHDFNNLLTIIRCHADLRLEKVKADPKIIESLKNIVSASDRAASLTRQLLAFGRRHILQPVSLNLNEVIRSMEQMVQSLLGEDVRFECGLEPDIPVVRADRWSMEQVLVNVVVNAAEAMTEGGQLSIVTAAVELDERKASLHPEARPGSFVCISIEDTGCGMDPATVNRIFEPFFSTKPVGKGSGMGLAMVYGIVKQHDGWIRVNSRVGKGTTFHIYLPVCRELSETVTATSSPFPVKGGTESVLIVEDNSELCAMASEVLASAGYRVFRANSGNDAMEVWSSCDGKIDLLFSDIVMPGGMSGSRLADKLKTLKPELKVILTSGHSSKLKKFSQAISTGHFMAKPYSPTALLERVRGCLDNREFVDSDMLSEAN